MIKPIRCPRCKTVLYEITASKITLKNKTIIHKTPTAILATCPYCHIHTSFNGITIQERNTYD